MTLYWVSYTIILLVFFFFGVPLDLVIFCPSSAFVPAFGFADVALCFRKNWAVRLEDLQGAGLKEVGLIKETFYLSWQQVPQMDDLHTVFIRFLLPCGL
jgi:hypothetical protein